MSYMKVLCRRLRTNRPKVGEYETRSATNIPWIPLDERFNGVKLDGDHLSTPPCHSCHEACPVLCQIQPKLQGNWQCFRCLKADAHDWQECGDTEGRHMMVVLMNKQSMSA